MTLGIAYGVTVLRLASSKLAASSIALLRSNADMSGLILLGFAVGAWLALKRHHAAELRRPLGPNQETRAAMNEFIGNNRFAS